MAKLTPAAKTAAAPAPAAPAAKKVAGKPAPAAVLNSPAVKAALKPSKAAPVEAEAEAGAAPAPKGRGPRGVTEDAVITVLVEANPKRPNSKAHRVFELYENGMTVGAFCDAAAASTDAEGKSDSDYATPCLVYDSAHGFISIEGYTPGPVKARKGKAKAAVTEEDGADEAAA